MKHWCAFILLLGTGYNIAAQTRLPTQYKPVLNEGASQERAKSPYEGRQIRSLEFRGDHQVPSGAIRDSLKVKVGDAYSAEGFETDMDRLRVLIFGRRGYLRARLGEPQIEDSPGGLDIAVPVQAGLLYRWGAIKVEDATLFCPEEIIQIVGLESGEIADGYGFQLSLSRLDALYRDRGYFQFSVGFIPDFKQNSPDAEEGVVDITLELEEGEVFRIDRIQFDGNSRTSDQAIRRRLLIREGDVYCESMLQESLSRLNSLGLFEKLTLEDAALHINGNSGRLDITIRLKEKGRETDR